MQIFRIADKRHPIWDGTGAMLNGGRWNSRGKAVIYGSLTFAGAMLEVLVRARIGKVPRNQEFVVADVPSDLHVERLAAVKLPDGWDADESTVARSLGDQWLDQKRSAVLLVPSVVARMEWNAIVNPLHPDALKISVSQPQPVIWDQRLFSGALQGG